MSTEPNIDALRSQIQEQATDLLNNNTDEIGRRLAEAAEGKVSFSIKVKLSLVQGKAYVESELSYTDKFRDKVEAVPVQFTDPDPEQIKIAGVEGN